MDSKAIASGFAIVECDCILELVQTEIERTSGIFERLDFYRSSQVCCETLWRWATRSDNKYEFCGIVDALGWTKV
jgi:hypothetical protein